MSEGVSEREDSSLAQANERTSPIVNLTSSDSLGEIMRALRLYSNAIDQVTVSSIEIVTDYKSSSHSESKCEPQLVT